MQCTCTEQLDKIVLYHCYDDTPNEALRKIAYDVEREREVKDPTSMRWCAEGEWKTLIEYQEWLKRK